MWAALLAHAHASGSMGFKSATSVCRGYTLLRHGELADAEASLRDGIEELTLGEARANGRVEIAAWLAAVERERGDLAAARRELEAVSDPGDASQAARYWLDSHAEQLLAEERFDEALAVARDAAERFAAHARDRHAGALAPGARAPPPRPARGGAGARRRGGRERRGAGARPRSSARALRVLGTVEHATGSSTCARPRSSRSARRRGSSSPRRWPRRAPCCAPPAGPTEARDPLRQALELADALGADALASQRRARSSTPPAAARARRRSRAAPR